MIWHIIDKIKSETIGWCKNSTVFTNTSPYIHPPRNLQTTRKNSEITNKDKKLPIPTAVIKVTAEIGFNFTPKSPIKPKRKISFLLSADKINRSELFY